MNSRPKQNPFRERTIAVMREWSGRIELNLEQVAWIQQDSRIQHHAALAQFGAPALHYGRRKAFRGYDAHGHVDWNAWPSTCVFRVRHAINHYPDSEFLQITKVT